MVVRRRPSQRRRRQAPAAAEGRLPHQGRCRAGAAELLVSVEHGTAVDPSPQTLGEYLDDWLGDVAPSLRPTTADLYRRAVSNWIAPRLGGVVLQALTPKHLQDLYAELLVSGRANGTGALSPPSVRLAHQVLHLALDRAADWRLIARNPAAAKLDLPRMVRPVMKTWTAEEARRFLTETAGERHGVVWALLLSTGLRRGEVLGLRWEDLDFDAGRLAVSQTVVVASNKAYLSEPKTVAGRRSVSLHPEMVAALHRRQAEQQGARALVGSAWRENDLVFTTALGTLIHPRNLARDFHAAVRRVGVRPIRLHDLRHTAATLALTGGAHPKQVQEMLGHARVAITLDVYSHVNEQMHAETAQKIGRQLFAAE